MLENAGAWCVLLASRQINTAAGEVPAVHRPASGMQALVARDPLTETLLRAAAVTVPERIAVVVSVTADPARNKALQDVALRNVLFQPQHKGTAHEVLLSLLTLENRAGPTAPILFLPIDHVVSDAAVMTRSLLDLAEWIVKEPGPVYLLGAVPEGPHDQLGYIIPWHDAAQIPTSVYEFVETPDIRMARKLINSGGLWNTFIFGGTIPTMLALFHPRFDAEIDALRRVLRESPGRPPDLSALRELYKTLMPVDFSRDLLATQTDKLNVVRMPRCGWWPLKSPKHGRRHGNPGATPAVFDANNFTRHRS